MADHPVDATVQARQAILLLEDAVLQALYQLALEGRPYVRTSTIANLLELHGQLQGPRGSTYASTFVLAICRRLHQRGRVRMGRPADAVHHGDKTTGWMIGAGEYQRRQRGPQEGNL